MKTLSQFFLTEDKNTHLEHLEDDILNHGFAGGQNAINFLVALKDMLEGNTRRSMNVTVKWDGAPAIFAGTNPDNDKFFVGTKSIFNKTPKINYTNADIDANHGGGLADKLKVALKYFPALKIPGIWQGDLLYTSEDLSTDTIDAISMIVFTPNTITYAVPSQDKLAQEIKRSKIGVVWHTTYTGRTMDAMSAKFGASVNKLNSTNNVWSTDATFRDTSGNLTFTPREATQFQNILNMASGSLKKASSYLRTLAQSRGDLALGTRLKIFLNSYIRGGEQIRDTRNVLVKFETYYKDVLQKKIDSVRTEAAKKKWTQHKKVGLGELKKHKASLYFVIATYISLQTAKTMVIRKLEKAESIGTFLKTPDGYKVTAPEGFVAIDHIGKALKLVDRLEFSRANFTADKNWVRG
ncbi:MAG TPA: hypothetical protein EYO99_00305 [Candidatus Marinimicrobia bacterium]|nr:hypothetical protein [Candidatus Neomarinimicrobiota bacterium]